MKRLIVTLFIFFGLLVPVATLAQASAIDILSPTGTTGTCNNSAATTKPGVCKDDSAGSKTNPIIGPSGILTVIIKLLALLVGIISVIIIVVCGMRIILSGGDANTAATARRGLVYASVGIAIAGMAQGIVSLVLNKL
jgi:hypothetical protein